MNKSVILLVIVAVVTLALGTASVAYAQSPTQASGTGTGWMGGRGSQSGSGGANTLTGEGILHDYMLAEYADLLNISAADLEVRIDSGETMAQIALTEGLTIDQFRTLMVEARTQAIDQALNDGVLTQAQADWMNQRSAGRMANGGGMRGGGQAQFANSNCPYYTQTNP